MSKEDIKELSMSLFALDDFDVKKAFVDLFTVLHSTKVSRERSLALTKLEECYLWVKEGDRRNEIHT